MAEVAVRILTDRTWPKESYDQLNKLPLDTGIKRVPFLGCGTLNYCSHLVKNPVLDWVKNLCSHSKTQNIILHFHNAWLSGSYLPVSLPETSVNSVVTFHGIADVKKLREKKIRRWIHSRIAQRLPKFGVKLVSVDKQGTITANELFGLQASDFTIIPNGLACPKIPVRENQPINHDQPTTFTIGFVSSLFPEKGWKFAAEAVSQLFRNYKNVRFIIAGMGPDLAEVRQWVGENHEFSEYRGFVSEPMRNLLIELDALVLPSSNEGLPMVILEALACGIPVLATPVGGIPDAIENGTNGLLIQRNPESIYDKLESMMNNPVEHNQMRKRARQSFEANYTIEKCAERYNTVYQSVMRESG